LISFIKYWALAGLLIPLAIMATTYFQGGVFEWPYLALALWPSSVFVWAGAAPPNPDPMMVNVFRIASIGLNVVLYSAAGAVVYRWFMITDR